MKVIVVGASGTVGSRVVPLLLEQGHEVTAGGRGSKRLDALKASGVTIRHFDIFNVEAARMAFVGHDAVINLATHVPAGNRIMLPWAWKVMDNIRRTASRRMAHAASDAGIGRFIQESFAPIYAPAGKDWIDENSPVAPFRYHKTVLDAERTALEFTRRGGAGIALRFAFFYGPGDPFIESMIGGVRRGLFPIPGSRNAYMPLISHEDAASAAVHALRVDPGIYNVVDNEPLTHEELATIVSTRVDVKAPRFLPRGAEWLAGGVGRTIARSLRISNRKLRETGWAPRLRDAHEGFAEAIEGVSSRT